MKKLTISTVATLTVILAASAGWANGSRLRAQTPNDRSRPYTCNVKRLQVDGVRVGADLIPSFQVEIANPAVSGPAPARQAERTFWVVSRHDGRINIEVKSQQGRTLSVSTTRDGEPLMVRIPYTNQAMICSQPRPVRQLLRFPRPSATNPGATSEAPSAPQPQVQFRQVETTPSPTVVPPETPTEEEAPSPDTLMGAIDHDGLPGVAGPMPTAAEAAAAIEAMGRGEAVPGFGGNGPMQPLKVNEH